MIRLPRAIKSGRLAEVLSLSDVSRQNIVGRHGFWLQFKTPCSLVRRSSHESKAFSFFVFEMRKNNVRSFAVRLLGTSLLLTVTAFSVGCGGSEKVEAVHEGQRTVSDDLGRTVSVPAKLERAVSLAPNLTEMIFAVGAGEKLVGVTTYCNYPEGAKQIEKVGDTQTPNIERIIALKPQVVFVSTASQLEAFTSSLAEQGISVYVTNPTTLDEVFKDLVQIGDLFGHREQADDLVASLKARVGSVENGSIGGSEFRQHAPRVFVQISKEPLFTIGKDSFLTALIDSAGGESVTRHISAGYPKISKETALALQPEVIILSDSEDNRDPNEVFKDSPAVRKSRVYRINADIISRPGPRLVDALEQIANDIRSANDK
jgi:iron complex transport system substrate-binding protein